MSKSLIRQQFCFVLHFFVILFDNYMLYTSIIATEMFESDDFDQVLSQFDFSDNSNSVPQHNTAGISKVQKPDNANENHSLLLPSPVDIIPKVSTVQKSELNDNNIPKCSKENLNYPLTTRNNNTSSITNITSPKHVKRKIINTHFDTKSKRKFPGPAGLLTGNFEEGKDETIGQIELLSQDIDFSQNHLQRDLFESPLWARLLEDIKVWNLSDVDQIKAIKQQALTGNLRTRKAQMVTAFVESVDRSAIDPLVKLRDTSGNIKCTLHRDAWSSFSPYIVSEYCALVLLKPTVLTTGSAFKKHYLNITLGNIYAIYSSAVLKEDEQPMPENYERTADDNCTVIKCTQNYTEANGFNISACDLRDSEELLDGLDSAFSDDVF